MEEIIGGMIVEGIFSFFEYPGAWIHWQLRSKRLPFKEVVERYFGINLLFSIVLYGTITIVVWKLLSF